VALSGVLSGCGGGEEFAANNAAPNGAGGAAGNTASTSATPGTDAATAKVTEPPTQLGKYGGTLTDASISDPKTLNLWVAAETSSTGAVGGLYDALLARNPYTLEWEGHLAELPKVSADNLTWTFQLKPDLKWSDGKPLTADDVIFTLDVIYDKKVQSNFREAMYVDVPDGKGGFKSEPLGYKKLDARTIEFKFPVPYAPARDILSFSIAPKHKLEAAYRKGQPQTTAFNSAWGVDTNPSELVSCGPWILKSYVPGQRLVYGRNPNYWKKDEQGRPLPYLDQYVSLIVPDVNTLTLKFRAGETDLLEGIQHTDFPSFKKAEKTGNYTTSNLGPSFSTNFISFNMNPKSVVAKKRPHITKAFRDQRFRQAVAHAMNRDRISEQVFLSLASPLYGPQTPANKQFYNPDVAKYPYDVAKAKALLAEMGMKDGNGNGILEMDGKDVKFNILTNVENNQRRIMASIIQDDLKKIGLGATATPITFNVLVAKLDAKPQPGQPYPPYDWDAIILGFTGGVEPHNGRSIWNSSGNLHQWYPYQSKPDTPWEAEIDKLFREGAQQMDEAKRREIYNRWQQIVSEQQPLVYTVTPDVLAAVRNKFGNLKPSNTSGVGWNTEEWFDLKATRESV
jgi:peptide/nickel transport system substrate-binding protein